MAWLVAFGAAATEVLVPVWPEEAEMGEDIVLMDVIRGSMDSVDRQVVSCVDDRVLSGSGLVSEATQQEAKIKLLTTDDDGEGWEDDDGQWWEADDGGGWEDELQVDQLGRMKKG